MGILHAPNDVWDRYYPAFGRFMHAFGTAEDDINNTLQRYVTEKLLGEKAQDFGLIQAILGGMRLKPLKDTFKRVLRTTSAPENVQDEFARVFGHLGDIQSLRDRLAHNAAFPDFRNGEWWFGTTNLNTLRESDQHEMLFFRVDMLDAAAVDLPIAIRAIEYALYPSFYDESDEIIRLENPEYVGHKTQATWLYKPSLLEREGPRSRPTPQSQPHQPKSSPKKQ